MNEKQVQALEEMKQTMERLAEASTDTISSPDSPVPSTAVKRMNSVQASRTQAAFGNSGMGLE